MILYMKNWGIPKQPKRHIVTVVRDTGDMSTKDPETVLKPSQYAKPDHLVCSNFAEHKFGHAPGP